MAAERLDGVSITGQDLERRQLVVHLKVSVEDGRLRGLPERAIANLRVWELHLVIIPSLGCCRVGCGET